MSVIADALRQAHRDEDRGRPSARPMDRAGLERDVQFDATQSRARDAKRAQRSRIVRGWLALPVAMCAVAVAAFGALLHPQSLAERVAPPPPAVQRVPATPAAALQPSIETPPLPQEELATAIVPVAAPPAPISADRYHLSGIMRTDEGLWAVINGAVVFTGDSVAGAEVIEIDTRGASIRTDGRETRLTLSGGKTGTN